MAEVLSQNEIDALLTAVTAGKVDAVTETAASSSAKGTSKKIALYDLTSEERVIRGKLVALSGIHERFAGLFRMSLHTHLKKNVSVKIKSTEFIKFGEYLSRVSRPVNFSLIEVEDLKGSMLLVAGGSYMYSLVDAYYGGSDRPYTKAKTGEAFTAIENAMMKKFVSFAVKDLEQAWSLNYPLKLNYIRAESNPFFIGAIQATDSIVVVTCDVEIDSLRGSFDLVVQLHPLDSIQHALSINLTGQIPGEETLWKEHWLKELMNMDFDIRGVLGQTEKTLREIRKLKKGDVLILGQDAVSAIPVYIQEVPKFKGMMGVFRGNNAVRLTKDLSNNEGD